MFVSSTANTSVVGGVSYRRRNPVLVLASDMEPWCGKDKYQYVPVPLRVGIRFHRTRFFHGDIVLPYNFSCLAPSVSVVAYQSRVPPRWEGEGGSAEDGKRTAARHVCPTLAVDDVVFLFPGVTDSEVDEHPSVVFVWVVVPDGVSWGMGCWKGGLQDSPDDDAGAVFGEASGQGDGCFTVFEVLDAVHVGADPV